jgi:hypothetical protein
MIGAKGVGSAADLHFAQRAEAASPPGALQPLSADSAVGGVSGAGGRGTSPASISGLGQLLSNLQHAQSQNPSQFPQLVSQIAGALQSAAAVHTGGASQLLTGLASSFEKAATTGTLPQLHPTAEAQSYTRTGQPVTSTAVNGTSSPAAASLQQLFAGLASQIGVPQS